MLSLIDKNLQEEVMKSFIEQARFYKAYHQKPVTRYTHFVGVPLIILSLMIFFGFIHIVVPGLLDFSLASPLTIAILIYYFFLNWRLGLAVIPLFVVLYLLAMLISRHGPTSTALWFFFLTFILGWFLQFLGHYFEGKRPAFVDNVWQALVAPLYLTAEILFMNNRLLDLKAEIDESPTTVVVED
ncbi:MAG: DUF962 domain-containing protein [Proteobacteria bacterium]|nr:DUF962 domain-containing protein [Pseudomonadota bacterium]